MRSSQTGLMERIQKRSEPVYLPARLSGGQLVSWLKQPGERVECYEPLAVVESDSVPTQITSHYTGTVRALMLQPGVTLEADAILCYVQPDGSPDAPEAPRNGSGKQKVLSITEATKALPEPVKDVIALSPLPVEEPLELAEVLQPQKHPETLTEADEIVIKRPPVVPEPTVKISKKREESEKEPRTQAKVYRLTPTQAKRAKKLAMQISAHDDAPNGPPVTESELVRAALEMLFALPQPALLAIVNENREREKAGRYGTGWPRPNYPKKGQG